MILGITHRHDLVEYSCVHREIQVFNHKLKKVANSFKYVTMECGTKYGMHFNRVGRGLVAKQLASEIWNLSAAEEMPPISLGWKVIQEQIKLCSGA
jgi:hypothetical protein